MRLVAAHGADRHTYPHPDHYNTITELLAGEDVPVIAHGDVDACSRRSSPTRGCCGWRERVTASTVSTGRRSSQRSSGTHDALRPIHPALHAPGPVCPIRLSPRRTDVERSRLAGVNGGHIWSSLFVIPVDDHKRWRHSNAGRNRLHDRGSSAWKPATSDLELNLPQVRWIGVGCPTRDSDAQTPPEARSCATDRSELLRVPAQIGQRRTR